MKTYLLGVSLLLSLFMAAELRAVDYSVEPLNEGPPAGELAPAIVEQLQTQGLRVKRGTRTLCDIWLLKEWQVPDLEIPFDILYPFDPGQLIGAVRFQRDSDDFRGQEIPKGIYTLRYAQQPVDGAHVGTSPTRDFLLVLPAKDDQSAEPLSYKQFTELSAQVVGTTHPALLSLKPASEGERPSIYQQEADEWWIVRMAGQVNAGGETKELPLDLVIVGQASEF